LFIVPPLVGLLIKLKLLATSRLELTTSIHLSRYPKQQFIFISRQFLPQPYGRSNISSAFFLPGYSPINYQQPLFPIIKLVSSPQKKQAEYSACFSNIKNINHFPAFTARLIIRI